MKVDDMVFGFNKTIPRFWTIEEQSKSIEFLVIKAYPFVK